MKRTGNTTPYEHFRAVMVARTPDGDSTEVIVTRQDVPGFRDRVWLTFHGSWRATVCLDGDAVHELRELLRLADEAGVNPDAPPTTAAPYMTECGSCRCVTPRHERRLLPPECPACGQLLDWRYDQTG